jgi:hypothetical protein
MGKYMSVINYSETRSILDRLKLNGSDIDKLVKDFPANIKYIERPS